jgi:hypothetical protein
VERSSILKAILQGHECGDNGRLIFTSEDLGNFATVPTIMRKRLRQQLINWLSDPTSPLFQDATLNEAAFVPMRDATMHLPFKIGGFSDFMCSDVHVDNVCYHLVQRWLISYRPLTMNYSVVDWPAPGLQPTITPCPSATMAVHLRSSSSQHRSTGHMASSGTRKQVNSYSDLA